MPVTLLLCLPTDCPYDPEGGGGWGRVSLPEFSLGHGCSELQAGVSCESSVAQMCLHGRFTLEDSKERVAGLLSQRWWWWPGLGLDEKTLVCQLEVTGLTEWHVYA